MASRTTLVLRTCRTRGTYLLRKTVQTILSILTCGYIRSQPEQKTREITDQYGNRYSFDPRTTDDQISAILAVPTGEFVAACNNVEEAFAKTDNLEVRIAPTRSKWNTADSWRIVHSCPDTGSGICLAALNIAQQTGIFLDQLNSSKVYTASAMP